MRNPHPGERLDLDAAETTLLRLSGQETDQETD
jgi:hypothetical protein